MLSAFVAVLCLSPVAFAATPRSYRVGATAVALLLSIAAVHGIIAASWYGVPAAILAWLTTVPVGEPRLN